MKPKGPDGSESATPPRPVLAAGRVRMVGDPVAFVVAESAEEARAAAEAVTAAYRPLAAETDAEAALQPGAPLLHDDARGNLCVDWELGERAAVEEALTAAAHRVSLETRNQRVIVCPMETRAALGAYDPGSGTYTLTAGTQGVHLVRNVLAKHVLKVPAQRVRVVTPDVGGAFGVKLWVYPELRAGAVRGAQARAAPSSGWRSAARPWRATTKVGTSARGRHWRWTPTGGSWQWPSRASPISAPMPPTTGRPSPPWAGRAR